MGIAYANVCDEYLNRYGNVWMLNETAIELTYRIQINDNIAFQPDFQYIIHPGALRVLDNAFVGLLRFEIGF